MQKSICISLHKSTYFDGNSMCEFGWILYTYKSILEHIYYAPTMHVDPLIII